MQILASSYFESELDELSKSKYRGHYGNVLKDCGDFLSSLADINDIHKLGDVVANLDYNDDRKPAKVRISNSTSKKGKSGGYRMLIFVLDEDDTIVLVSIYAKIGPLGKDKPTLREWKALLRDYIDSFEDHGIPLSMVEILPNGRLSIKQPAPDDEED